jgi:hypothetical protein
MVVKSTRSGLVVTREIAAEVATPLDPFAEFSERVEQARQRFRGVGATPRSCFDLENELKAIADDFCRRVFEEEVNRLESDDKEKMPSRVRYRGESYRRNKKTPASVATRFGTIVLRSFYYLNEEPGEPGLHPLWVRLGIGAGVATPALLERVARASVDHTQTEVRAWLLREHGLKWSNDRLRKALRGFRDVQRPFVAKLQKARLLAWMKQAQESSGRHRPVLAVGRDGIMIPMRSGGYQEASTATVSVYDRQRQRLGTVYLGQMPETKQATLSAELTGLLKETLEAWQGPAPRLACVTDKGSAPDAYYKQVLKKMKHPRDGKRLAWEWVLDFFHVCGYIGKMAAALFGAETKEGMAWFAKMRHWLRDRKQGAAHVLRSATHHRGHRKMTKAQRTEFGKAYRYVRNHRRWMDYQGYRRRGLPIGSGVTEAACKTVFTQRFKRSGMRWRRESGQVILDLRVCYLSGIWEEAFACDLDSRTMPESADPQFTGAQTWSSHSRRRIPGLIAA